MPELPNPQANGRRALLGKYLLGHSGFGMEDGVARRPIWNLPWTKALESCPYASTLARGLNVVKMDAINGGEFLRASQSYQAHSPASAQKYRIALPDQRAKEPSRRQSWLDQIAQGLALEA